MSTLHRRLEERRYPVSRLLMPYGVYHCADEHEFIFNRLYSPIIERIAGGPPMACEPRAWIGPILGTTWLFNDATAPWSSSADKGATLARIDAVLSDWGVEALPDYGGRVAGRFVNPWAQHLKPSTTPDLHRTERPSWLSPPTHD